MPVAPDADFCRIDAAPRSSRFRIPDEAPTELTRRFEPLGRYVEEEFAMTIRFVPVTDYAAMIESLAARKLDMASLGGFTLLQARLGTGNAIPLVQRAGDEKFVSHFITSRSRLSAGWPD